MKAYLVTVDTAGFGDLPEVANPVIMLDALPRVNDELSYRGSIFDENEIGSVVIAVVQGIRWKFEALDMKSGLDVYVPTIILGRHRR